MKGFLVFTSVALLSVGALAQTPAPETPAAQVPPPETSSTQMPASQASGASVFDSFDTNHDGRISATEAQVNSTINDNFKGADTDADGALSQAEFDAAFKPANPSEASPPQQ